jgi:hypothetical protein
MFIPIDIKIQVGEFVGGYSKKYKDQHGNIQMYFIRGILEKVDEAKKLVKIEKYPEMLEIFRIEWFTFGGIRMSNTDFRPNLVWGY